jgi:large subunit ribosomal protein L18
VDDVVGKTLVGCSTLDDQLRSVPKKGTVAGAAELGKVLAAQATKRGITEVVFDRGGYDYHGRVRALAEAARAGGLQF